MWSVVWALLPKRYLIAAGLTVAALAAILVSVKVYGSHREAAGYTAGYNHATTIQLQKRQAVLDSNEVLQERNDSLTAVQAGHAVVVAKAAPRVLRTVPATVDTTATVPLANFVRLYTDNDSVGVLIEPRGAAEWAAEDSAFHQVVVPALLNAVSQLRNERLLRHESDSLAAGWKTQALSATPTPKAGMSWSGKALHALAWAGVTLIVARQVRR